MIGYIYKTTNLINSKIYIGKRQKEYFDKYYLGSGVILQQAIKKYGKENFSCEIIEECDTINLLNEREIYWIKYYNSTNRTIGYNISLGGDGGWYGVNLNKEYKHNIIVNSNKNRIVSERSKEKNRISNKSRWTNELRKQHSIKLKNIRKNKTPEQLLIEHINRSNAQKGKIPWNKGLTKDTDKRVAKFANSLKGRVFSAEHKKNLSDSHKKVKDGEVKPYNG